MTLVATLYGGCEILGRPSTASNRRKWRRGGHGSQLLGDAMGCVRNQLKSMYRGKEAVDFVCSGVAKSLAFSSLLITSAVLLIGCGRGDPGGDAPMGMPASFAPTSEVVQANGRTAQCNTVHSLTLPEQMIEKLSVNVDPDTAVISCSLQVIDDGVLINLPAEVRGTATALSGNIAQIEFKEVVEEEALSYVGTFSIAGKAGVRFDVTLLDPQTGARYDIDFEQTRI